MSTASRPESRFPIPVTILTGFLGAGKTTLLNHILNMEHGRRIAVLVNDFGAINIDNALIVDAVAQDTIELSNGCICCTIRGDLLHAVLSLARREDPPEHIIIEASGVSDPLEIALTFRMPELAPIMLVDSVVTLIDADQVLELSGQNEILAVMQVGAADLVLLNKVDLVSVEKIEKIRQWVRSIVPDARIIESSFARIPLEIMMGIQRPLDEIRTDDHINIHVHEDHDDHDHPHDHSLLFHTWSWQTDEALSSRCLKRIINRLPTGIYRAKGIIHLTDDPDYQGIFQLVGKRASISKGPRWGNQPRRTQIVCIGDPNSINPNQLETMFASCLESRAPRNEFERITRGAMNWIRGKAGPS